ncbi:HlyD family efflux transporter periplasmic adaptor subunit [uncultured Methylophaga sp.]|jgi:cobalt-zinc-cadmium efflux system membrane fusion protein|uniref:efflux RND transporter periplasmic adaptor subunit n=1 Tax=uncultured Methylophaga sp. TaxID=285271 RepID=UPI0026065DAA|nr:HlyD family efflux transporter periplasmic adaptor subunit [uncultured Methylophaga sp.]
MAQENHGQERTESNSHSEQEAHEHEETEDLSENANEAGHDHAEKAHSENSDEHGHDHGAEEKSHVEINDEMARQQGMVSAKVSSGEIALTTKLYGRAVVSPEQISHIRARFPGKLTRVNVNLGDTVKKGQAIASVESNNSLQNYSIYAPIAGIVTAKDANTGEVAAEQILFTITNTGSLWAELRVFPQQATAIERDQSVHFSADNTQFSSKIEQILPSSNNSPYQIARVPIDNSLRSFFPGLLVEADVVINQKVVGIRIPNSAIQRYEGAQVAFVKDGNKYLVKPLELGISDGVFSEVLTGLQPDDEIVVENSYLIKADLEKEGAAHAH